MTHVPTVLFVCYANRARSAYAHVRAEAMAGDGLRITSGGTHARPGLGMEPGMLLELGERGLDGTHFVSRPLTREAIAAADVVLTAGVDQRAWILDDHPGALRKLFTVAQFNRALDAVSADAPDVVAAAFAAKVPARRSEDVPDPWGRDQAVAAASAAYLDAMLERIIPGILRP